MHLFDPSGKSSKNQTKQRTMYKPDQLKMGSLGSITSENLSVAEKVVFDG